MLSGLSEGWTAGDEGPGTWSPYQVLGHLTHIEEVDWIDRTRIILAHGTTRAFEPVDREAGFTRFKGWSVGDLLDRFASIRTSNLSELEVLVRIEDLERRGVHPDFGEVTLGQLLATWVVHDLNHLGQIVKAMAFFRKVFPFSKKSFVLLESENHLCNRVKASRRTSICPCGSASA